MSLFARALAVVAVAGLLACPQGYKAKIQPGSTSSSLTFLLGDGKPRPLDLVQVLTCDRVDDTLAHVEGDTLWRIEGWELGDSPRRYDQVQYGVVPEGFHEVAPARRLDSGCYAATIMAGGTASLRFWVDSNRAVRSWSRRDLDSSLARFSQHATASNYRADSAVALCLTAYANGRTLDDTAATDRWVPVRDLLSRGSFSCRDYRRLVWSRFQNRPWAEDSGGSSQRAGRLAPQPLGLQLMGGRYQLASIL